MFDKKYYQCCPPHYLTCDWAIAPPIINRYFNSYFSNFQLEIEKEKAYSRGCLDTLKTYSERKEYYPRDLEEQELVLKALDFYTVKVSKTQRKSVKEDKEWYKELCIANRIINRLN